MISSAQGQGGPAAVASLAGVRAQRRLRRFLALPSALRTPARAAPVLDQIFLYAYEPVGPEREMSWEDSRRVSARLQEFLGPPGRGTLMPWLHENLVDEAWRDAEALRAVIGDCLQSR